MGNIKLAGHTLGTVLFIEVAMSSFNFAFSSYFVCTVFEVFILPFSWGPFYDFLINLLLLYVML
jgi:hypothetical protein